MICLKTNKKSQNLSLITKTRLFKYIENFTTQKGIFLDKKKSDIFHISAQNTGCRRGGSNESNNICLSKNKRTNVYSFKHQILLIKMGFNEFKIIQVCFRDVCKRFWNIYQIYP